MDAGPAELTISFFPPLHQQRRTWVLDTLRREGVSEIVDIGCGEGKLLATLCQPAPWLGPQSQYRRNTLSSTRNADDCLASMLDDVLLNDSETRDLHPTRIAGLDIDTKALQCAAEDTSPSSANPLYTRWEPLEVSLWHGSLDSINTTFVDVECIVATEVIEHLTDDLVQYFAPVLLGVYHPRIFLMTTPSYTFNARFSPPGTRDLMGHADPTGRTDRVFRHRDHKFEWTIEEFSSWCVTVSKEWGYTVEIGNIGYTLDEDPWGRDKELGGASQVAAFKRMDDSNSKRKRERRTRTVYAALEKKDPHRLVVTHYFAAHPQAGRPHQLEEIGAALLRTFEGWGENVLRVEDLWFSDDTAVLCGGSVELLMEMAERDSRLQLRRVPGQRKGNWTVELLGGVQRPKNNWSAARTSQHEETVEESMEEDQDQEHSPRSGIGLDAWNNSGVDSWREDNNWAESCIDEGGTTWGWATPGPVHNY
ncbi:hypothetical protein EDD16DRAFT_1546743 [Pisolithus croceorrhizus]|nr:hypothetical protein EV401DRAFT_1946465 [Pisolithus croceorrhizus]KAI6129012.1 hypothetical protein EDD16DRAFT_1546743 [Pisolithus croceorrhizus]KAI6168090.1 hypothetical protein EDD17DRAFT_1531840 [Pisolithus thermaeus]